MSQQSSATRCGFVAIVGRPNVGKSTLMNHLLGQKISITSRKPQTTRHQILGILTEQSTQIIFVDTPGMHQGHDKAINRAMNKTADAAIQDVDAVIFVVDRTVWTAEDEWVLAKIRRLSTPVLLLLNKVDQLENKQALLPHIALLNDKHAFYEVIPVSALRGHNMEHLMSSLTMTMPSGPFHFPHDQITDRNQRFMAAEIIREKITRQLGAELPYATAVEIEQYQVVESVLHIHGLILVERAGQKRIIIGDKGSRIKKVGQDARKDMELLFGGQVMLNLWVKVKSGWADDERALKSLGY